jgi:hypothetical protein
MDVYPMLAGGVRLTDATSNAGCAATITPKAASTVTRRNIIPRL